MKLTLCLLLLLSSSYYALSSRNTATADSIQVSENETFKITLDCNPCTGFQWHLTSENATLLDSTECTYQPYYKGVIGSGGKETWLFKAKKKGTTSLTFKYARPWDTNSISTTKTVKVVIL